MNATVLCMQCGRAITAGDDSRISHGFHEGACRVAGKAWMLGKPGAVMPTTLSLVRVSA